MEDNICLKEMRANYGHKIVDYRWIGLGKGPKFTSISNQYDLVNAIYDLGGADKRLGLAETFELGPKYGWSEKERRNLLYTTRRHTMPRTPLPVKVLSLTHFSITLDRLGTFKLKRPITSTIENAYLVRAGARTPQSIYLAFSIGKDSDETSSAFRHVQARSGTFRHVQAQNGNAQAQ